MKAKIIAYGIGPVGSALLGLITLPLLAWFYPVEDIGRISMLQVAAGFIVLLFCLGLDQAYTREYYEEVNKAKLFKQCVYPGTILILISVFLLIFFGIENLSKWLYDIESKYLAIISTLSFIFVFLSRFLSLILRMEDKAFLYSLSQLLPKAIFVLFIVFSVSLGLASDFNNLILANFLSIVSVFAVLLWSVRNTIKDAIKNKFDYTHNLVLIRFGWPLVVGGLASWGLNVMDKIFLRNMSTFSELGVYSVTFSLAAVVTIVTGVFNTIWAPMVYKWLSHGLEEKKVYAVSEHVLAVVYFFIVLSGLFSWIFPYFLPEDYVDVRYIFTICIIGPLLYTLSETTTIGIAITRKTVYSMLASIGAVLVNFLGNYLLVPEYGALGASISTAVAFFVFYILRTEFSCLVWRRVPRFKSYFSLSIVIIVSICSGVFQNLFFYFFVLWLILFFIGLYFFKSSVKLSLVSVKKIAFKNKSL